MQGDLYSPSLANGEAKETKSYDIGYLFYVAFIGGIIAVSVLGIRNAKWLHVEKKFIKILVTLSTVLFVCKSILAYLSTHQLIGIESSSLKIFSRGFAILCFLFYYLFLKGPFKEHIVINGNTEPLLKQGVIWCLIAALIESAIIIGISNF